jgi:hypothetical protein
MVKLPVNVNATFVLVTSPTVTVEPTLVISTLPEIVLPVVNVSVAVIALCESVLILA